MPVISVTRVGYVGGGRTESDRETSDRYIVKVSNPLDTPDTVRLAPGVPRVGEALSFDSAQRVTRVSVQRDDDKPTVWTVDVDYSTDSGGGPGAEAENPLERPRQLAWSVEPVEIVVDKQRDGSTITNSAGEQPIQPIVDTEYLPVLRVTKNQATFSVAQALQYAGAINSDAWFGFQPLQARIRTWAAEELYENGVWYWRVALEVIGRDAGWTYAMLDQGYYYRSGDGRTGVVPLQRIKDQAGQDAQTPQLLDGAGGVLIGTAPPVYRTLHLSTRKELPFNGVVNI